MHILKSNGLDHAIWALRTQEKKYSVEFAVGCAENVLNLFESKYPEDKRPRNAIDAAKRYLENPSEENRLACWAAAGAACDAASSAWAAADAADAAGAAYAADAACAACDAARAAYAARGAVGAAWAARGAVGAAWAARAAEREFQKELFLKIVSQEDT
jgi:hypothetical protein